MAKLQCMCESSASHWRSALLLHLYSRFYIVVLFSSLTRCVCVWSRSIFAVGEARELRGFAFEASCTTLLLSLKPAKIKQKKIFFLDYLKAFCFMPTTFCNLLGFFAVLSLSRYIYIRCELLLLFAFNIYTLNCNVTLRKCFFFSGFFEIIEIFGLIDNERLICGGGDPMWRKTVKQLLKALLLLPLAFYTAVKTCALTNKSAIWALKSIFPLGYN